MADEIVYRARPEPRPLESRWASIIRAIVRRLRLVGGIKLKTIVLPVIALALAASFMRFMLTVTLGVFSPSPLNIIGAVIALLLVCVAVSVPAFLAVTFLAENWNRPLREWVWWGWWRP